MRTAAKKAWYSSLRISLPDDALALVLAGGKGTRLKADGDPELRSTPKVLVSIDRPGGATAMLGHTLTELDRCGFPHIAVLTGADPEAGAAAVESYTLTRRAGCRFGIYREPYPLGTAGAVYAALSQVTASVAVVVPADTLFPHALLPAAVVAHQASGHGVTWTVTTEPDERAQNRGKLLVENDRIAHVLEGLELDEPDCPAGADLRPATSAGVIIVDRARYVDHFERYVERLDEPGPTDLYRQFVPWLLSRRAGIGAFDIRQAAPDLGTPERFRAFGRTGAVEAEGR
ncbi:NTP transferase domain-containing protein [Actinomadura chibensis]|uniref:NTP transferase domain-containing protein n=1 Tax=Actinomadura chibensis TaxID=392828 RepID=A0A5D0NT40_9ACTN|nr:NTP transferase domain-containing protein [Actinomadura chibensis]TYB47860.1 NTP transferase domain-containing protein [Actinomadura chibensis]